MLKSPEEQAEAAVALFKALMETHTVAETGLMLTGALIGLLRRMGIEDRKTLEIYGRAFSEMYLAENEEEKPCTQ